MPRRWLSSVVVLLALMNLWVGHDLAIDHHHHHDQDDQARLVYQLRPDSRSCACDLVQTHLALFAARELPLISVWFAPHAPRSTGPPVVKPERRDRPRAPPLLS